MLLDAAIMINSWHSKRRWQQQQLLEHVVCKENMKEWGEGNTPEKRKRRDPLNARCNSKACFSLLIVCRSAVGSCVNSVCYSRRKLLWATSTGKSASLQSLADTMRQRPRLHMLFNPLHSVEYRSTPSIRQLKPGSLGTACSLHCHVLPSRVAVTQCGSFVSPEPWHCAMIYLSNNEQRASSAWV